MAASRKALALNALAGSNWSLGLIVGIKKLEDRIVVKLADGTFRQAVIKTARAVRAIKTLEVQDMYDTVAPLVNEPVAFCAAAYNGRSWSADQWFVGVITADDYLAMRTETFTEELPF